MNLNSLQILDHTECKINFKNMAQYSLFLYQFFHALLLALIC